MLNIESKNIELNRSSEEIYLFLKNLDNTSKLMPPQISNWKGSEYKASYTLQGMANIEMAIVNGTANKKIEIKSTQDKPFTFSIDYIIESVSPNQSKFKILFVGDVNPFMKVMVEKPLTNLFNYMAEQLPKQFS
ncbi:MAG: hypothetical protein IT239_02895 [Bacteroidia bacterium]|nr:hypothetical protein [Bacteroidia bacterium]